jgi:tetratricopeptide (TPR) repeat protein
MAIEGPLRELGIHDVFQLLDLSRKTGALRVTSALRDNEGIVHFDAGKVVSATIRSNPHLLGDLLLRAGKIGEADLARARALQKERGERRRLGEILVGFGVITTRELERQVRLQIEAVIFELMSWQEGFFSFVEGDVSDVPTDALVRISTESLLMEGARRIDEWARIAHKIPHLGMVPLLADHDSTHPSLLDLLPSEWETLGSIDGDTDLRGIAHALSRSEFDVAKVAYGLLSTGVIELREPVRAGLDIALGGDDPAPHLRRARSALAAGAAEEALIAASAAATAAPQCAEPHVLLARALARLHRFDDASEELQRALRLDPRNPEALLALGHTAARRGKLDDALTAWKRYMMECPPGEMAPRVRELMDSTERLRVLLGAADHV